MPAPGAAGNWDKLVQYNLIGGFVERVKSLPVGGLHVEVVDVHVYPLPRGRYHSPHTLSPSRGRLRVARGLDLRLRFSLL